MPVHLYAPVARIASAIALALAGRSPACAASTLSSDNNLSARIYAPPSFTPSGAPFNNTELLRLQQRLSDSGDCLRSPCLCSGGLHICGIEGQDFGCIRKVLWGRPRHKKLLPGQGEEPGSRTLGVLNSKIWFPNGSGHGLHPTSGVVEPGVKVAWVLTWSLIHLQLFPLASQVQLECSH